MDYQKDLNDSWERFLKTGNITDYVKHKKFVDKVHKQQVAEAAKIGENDQSDSYRYRPKNHTT